MERLTISTIRGQRYEANEHAKSKGSKERTSTQTNANVSAKWAPTVKSAAFIDANGAICAAVRPSRRQQYNVKIYGAFIDADGTICAASLDANGYIVRLVRVVDAADSEFGGMCRRRMHGTVLCCTVLYCAPKSQVYVDTRRLLWLLVDGDGNANLNANSTRPKPSLPLDPGNQPPRPHFLSKPDAPPASTGRNDPPRACLLPFNSKTSFAWCSASLSFVLGSLSNQE